MFTLYVHVRSLYTLYSACLCARSGPIGELNLTINTDMQTVVKAMAQPDSGLEIRDRMWLKITIPNAFIGELPNRCLASSLVFPFLLSRSLLCNGY